MANPRDPLEVIAVHEPWIGWRQKSPRKAELVKLRYFLGCTMAEAAQILGIAPATAERIGPTPRPGCAAMAPGRGETIRRTE